MQTKIYFANTVPAAIEAAREELGPDALLVNSRPVPPGGRGLGKLEVTFAWDPPAQAKSAPKAVPPASELDEIRQQLSALRMAMGGTQGGDSTAERESAVVRRLCEAGFERESARTAAGNVTSESVAIRMLTAKIPVAPFVEMQPGEGRVLAFVGPPGRGKTTSIVKLAVAFGLARRVPVKIYSAGAHPVGAQEQMARYASILGVPQQAFESVDSLGLALNGEGVWKGLALIDTPGFSPADQREIVDFGRFFAARPEIETHLVLRAEGRAADHLNMIARFSGFRISRLLFTGMDEAASMGATVDTLIRGGIPATFVGTGPQIPEGLEEIDPGRLVRGIWNENPAERRLALAAA